MTKTHQPTTNVPSTSSERTVPRPALPSRQFEDEEDLTRYRRVRLRLAESQALIQHLGGCRLKLYELRKNEWYELGTGYARTIASPVRQTLQS